MIDIILESVRLLQIDASAYSVGTRRWMKFMAFTFLMSVLFVYFKSGARWIFGAFAINVIGLVSLKIVFPEVERAVLGTYIHLIAWPVMLWMAWRPNSRETMVWRDTGWLNRVYLIWLIWASIVMTISLAFDLKYFLGLMNP